MRFLFIALMILLFVGLLAFHVTNLDSKVTVSLLGTAYEDIPVGVVAILAVAVGAILVGIVAIAEGARTRLDNRRLTREIHRMGTEVNFLRTQPTTTGRPEPDVLEVSRATPLPTPPVEPAPGPSSAPIYDADQDDWPRDDDDEDEDAYTGGRAV